ncbi:MAG TPA: decaprenyl-phosphate phosphoribosyltransferase [candidate division Zixibacteria bacterium]|nr:decaprenyl-phosphate phosphoribosyltransferase [candidate division Zixibacteria bacterium]
MFLELIKLARPRHWIKNGVVLAAVIFAGQATVPGQLELSFLAVAIFCMLSSAVYTLNDIVDRNKDRLHPRKKTRPIASGTVPVSVAAVMLILLVVIGLTAAWFINLGFFLISCAYFVLNVLYSFWLKNVVIADVMAIAIGFVLRAYAGAFAIDVVASKWLLINTLLLALFLGFGKRRHELGLLEGEAKSHRRILDHYSQYLLDQLIGVVTPSVLVVYMLYTFSAEVSSKLGTENLFITIPFVIYGIFRYLYLIHKKDEGGSPTRVLTSDKPMLIDVVLWLVTVFIVLYIR